eukprot:680751-Prorocentrum_minimum.AAC.1
MLSFGTRTKSHCPSSYTTCAPLGLLVNRASNGSYTTSARVCGPTGLRVYGSTGLRVYGSTGLRVYGSAGLRVYGSTGLR